MCRVRQKRELIWYKKGAATLALENWNMYVSNVVNNEEEQLNRQAWSDYGNNICNIL